MSAGQTVMRGTARTLVAGGFSTQSGLFASSVAEAAGVWLVTMALAQGLGPADTIKIVPDIGVAAGLFPTHTAVERVSQSQFRVRVNNHAGALDVPVHISVATVLQG